MFRKLALGAFLLGLSASAFAQRTTGGITGVVKDSSGAVLPGATVSVTGPNIVGTQTATTNEQGLYRVQNLPPGEYQVSYTLAGFKTLNRKAVRVGLGQQLEENASLEVSQLQESVEVLAESSAIDTTSNEVGSNYDRSWVENAPLRRYSFFDLVKSSPGTLDGGDGSRRSMVYGSGYDENSFQLDGVDITDNFFNESSAEPNVDAIEEVEVLSLGAPAEYGNLTGAVFNIVTRQGTNQFHGDVNFFYQGDGLTADNTKNLKNPDGTYVDACPNEAQPNLRCPFTRDKYNDFTAQLGGPIIKDKLWFFASFQMQRDYYGNVGVNTVDPLAEIKDRANRYLGKINWQISPKHKLVGTFHLDDKTTDNGLIVNQAPSTAWTRHSSTPTPGLNYTGVLSDKTVVEARFSGFYGDVNGGPTAKDQPKNLTRFYNLDTGFVSGGHYYWYEVQPRRTTVTANVSHHADSFLKASHDFKFGVQYSDAVAKGIYGYNDLVFTYTADGTEYGYGYERQPFSYSGNSRNIGFFVDDTIRAGPRLTFNLGVRYDDNHAYSAAQQELDANGNPTGVTYPRTDLYTWKYWSPRFGFNWKMTSDGKTVLAGHMGRYHRSIATGEFANVIGPNVKPTYSGTYDFATHSFPDPSFFEGNSNLGVDPNYSSPYVDQYILSLQRELGKSLGAQLHYVYKRGRNYPAWEDITGQYVQVPYTDDTDPGATGRTFDIWQLTSDPADRQFRITNPAGVNSDVQAVDFNVVKRMSSKWQLNASATWLKATGRLQESKGTVGIQQRSGLQFRDFGKNKNDFVNTDGRLRLDVTWDFKLQAVYQLPLGFMVSANITYRDNAWTVRRANVPSSVTNIPEGTLIMLEPRGDLPRLSMVTFFDMRLLKHFNLGKDTRFSIFADALNLTNSSAYEGVLSSTITSSSYLFPAAVINPRRIMVGTKFQF